MQFVVQHDEEHLVRYVELVVLDVVVGTPVLAFTELVVAAAVFPAVSHDGRRDGSGVRQEVIVVVG